MAKSKQTIRIISGTHRSRRLPVLDVAGLRPTGDRLREMLFNWLQMDIAGKNVVDLCAGSGALGFEAASRGAKSVVLVESNNQVAQQLSQIKNDFKFGNVQIFNQSAQSYLQSMSETIDVVFLDPPFDANLLQKLSDLAIQKVSNNGYLYRESAISTKLQNLPNNWQLFRQKTAGQVKIELWLKLNQNHEE